MNSRSWFSAALVSLSLAFALWTPARAGTVSPERTLRGIDADIAAAMRELQVPGVAVGVIANGRVILAKGYGVAEIGKPVRVDADTIFAVASMSKSFTTAVMATLVEEGKLDWDRPVRDYLAEFRMFDPVASELVTPRDLVTHRTGLASHDFLRKSTHLDRAELVRRIRYLPPSKSFRSEYQYNNLMYVVAGHLSATVGGEPWESLVQHRIFDPLRMDRSNTLVAVSARMPNHASPHKLSNGKVIVTGFYDYQKFGVGPNGAVNSTVNDFLKYLRMYLDHGRAGDRQVISAAQVKELFRPVIVDGPDGTYGLAWHSRDRHGVRMLDHSGLIDGFHSQMILAPERNFGIVVLSNLYRSGLPRRIAWPIADRLLGVEPSAMPSPEPESPSLPLPVRVTGTQPSADVTSYTGKWFHPAYGNVEVTREGTSLIVHFDAVQLRLSHYHYDTFRIGDTNQLASFRLDEAGKVARMYLPLEPDVEGFAFSRSEDSDVR